MDPVTVCLVACGSSKRDGFARAKDLYTGHLFRLARRFAEQCDDWRILSAKHRLVRPNKWLVPYNQRLAKRGEDLTCWGLTVASGLHYEMGGIRYRVIMLAGADYADPVCRVLEPWGIQVEQPLRGMGIGHRLQWLKNETDASALPWLRRCA